MTSKALGSQRASLQNASCQCHASPKPSGPKRFLSYILSIPEAPFNAQMAEDVLHKGRPHLSCSMLSSDRLASSSRRLTSVSMLVCLTTGPAWAPDCLRQCRRCRAAPLFTRAAMPAAFWVIRVRNVASNGREASPCRRRAQAHRCTAAIRVCRGTSNSKISQRSPWP